MEYRYNQSLGNLSVRVSRALGRKLTHIFRENNLSLSAEHWIMLAALYEKEGRTQKELVEVSNRDKTNVTRLLAFLEEEGFVLRLSNQHDRRKKEVYLTDRAKQLKPFLQGLASQTLEEATEGVGSADLSVCLEVLRAVCCNLEGESLLPTEI